MGAWNYSANSKKTEALKKFSTHVFPCLYNQKNIEKNLCKIGIENLIGNSKEHIMNFPDNIFSLKNINICQIYSHDNIDFILHISQLIFKGLTSNYFNLDVDNLKTFSLDYSNSFLIAEIDNQFLGMFFSLRLKLQSFNKLLTFEMSVDQLTDEDFANYEEEASIFLVSVFAYNEKIAMLLYIKFYAHIIANQNTIINIGTTTLLNGGKKLVEKMHLLHLRDKKYKGKLLSAYSASLEEVLLNEDILKIIFKTV